MSPTPQQPRTEQIDLGHDAHELATNSQEDLAYFNQLKMIAPNVPQDVIAFAIGLPQPPNFAVLGYRQGNLNTQAASIISHEKL
ncbi:hypothetical protein GNI_059180 [Gregarina niphandrodes]|uniref:Uncharacterized protein n=1 Tax=Gregarina niphandrodes TaxID=110365 RepID=A0A023B8L4_GRENI|nr:hypothetical protein GNI_059180 [Gregarina niphandrodes]EZG69203.1 hypothetical protein GNI_059180 [Gregarina niphandrodes]|eukprot:XP_011134463.1 hypothetical protein GNI_059180 [Gregarina niphandrodes]